MPVFEKVGRIYEMRLMMDFSGHNRGYAFVVYSSPSEAKESVRSVGVHTIYSCSCQRVDGHKS